MIEISTQANAATGTQADNAGTTVGGGSASGFLHLFEIILGGMPQGGLIGSVAGLIGGGNSKENAPDGMPTASDTATAAHAGTSIVDLLGEGAVDIDAELLQSGMGLQEAKAIASILQTLGFSVQPAEIASLGELDMEQLASAMEFLQRGVEAGLPGDALLENASCLLPRQWDFDGGKDLNAPHVEGLAAVDESASGIDPASILAGAEAIRRILLPGIQEPKPVEDATPALVATASSTIPTVQAPVAPISNTGVQATPETVQGLASVADPSGKGKTAKGDVQAFPARGITAEGTSSRGDAPSSEFARVVSRGATTPGAVRPEIVADRGSVHGDARTTDPQDARPGVKPFSSAVNADQAIRSNASSPAGAAPESPFAMDWGSRLAVAEGTRETTSTTVSQGVRAGSMASEFIGRQVLEKVDVQLRQGRRELNVRLWPEELGEVRLSLRVGEADKLDARIMVQTESVRQAILDATPQLREALSRHGMEMGRLSVNIDSGMASGGGDASGDGRKERGDGEGRFRNGRWQDEEVEYGAALALGVDSGYRDGRNTLDMWS